MKTSVLYRSKIFKILFEIALISIATYVLWPNFNEIIKNLDTVKNISTLLLFTSFGIFLLSLVLSAISIKNLSSLKLSLKKLVIIQGANLFTNRLLPSGLGAIATNTAFLKKSGLKIPAALTIIAANNTLGFLAFTLIGLSFGLLNRGEFNLDINLEPFYVFIALIFAIFILFIFMKFNRSIKVDKIFKDILHTLKYVIKRPLHTLISFLANCGITFTHLLCLIICLDIANLNPSLVETFLIFTAGMTALTISPTLNGLGVTELAMVTAIKSLGLPADQALIATVSYRLVTFWLPIIPGYICLKITQVKKYI